MRGGPVDCGQCEDTGWVPIPDGSRVTRCACVRARATGQRIEGAGLPAKYAGATFENFLAYNPTLVAARQMTQRWAEAYPALPRRLGDSAGRGLVLSGPAGVGKTHLAAALLKHVVANTGISGLFYTTKDLLWAIRQSYNPAIQTTESQVLTPILTCDLLVLDDLGEERVTEWVAETMNLIVNTRYNQCRPIICTTNFPDVDDDQEVNGLLWRIGFRMQSRLHEMCEFVELDGASYRDLPPNGTEADLRRLAKATRKITPARAQMRRPPGAHDGKGELKWPGGKGGNH